MHARRKAYDLELGAFCLQRWRSAIEVRALSDSCAERGKLRGESTEKAGEEQWEEDGRVSE